MRREALRSAQKPDTSERLRAPRGGPGARKGGERGECSGPLGCLGVPGGAALRSGVGQCGEKPHGSAVAPRALRRALGGLETTALILKETGRCGEKP